MKYLGQISLRREFHHAGMWFNCPRIVARTVQLGIAASVDRLVGAYLGSLYAATNAQHQLGAKNVHYRVLFLVPFSCSGSRGSHSGSLIYFLLGMPADSMFPCSHSAPLIPILAPFVPIVAPCTHS